MRSGRVWSLACLALGSLLLAGCTGSEVLSTGNAQVTVVLEFVNASDTRFGGEGDQLQFSIQGLGVRPPEGSPTTASIGTLPLNPFGGNDVQVRSQTGPATTTVLLPAARYRVETVRISSVIMRDNDPGAPQCVRYNVSPNPVYRMRTVSDPSEPLPEFTVNADGTSAITVRIDAEGFLARVDNGSCNPIRGLVEVLPGTGPTYVEIVQ